MNEVHPEKDTHTSDDDQTLGRRIVGRESIAQPFSIAEPSYDDDLERQKIQQAYERSQHGAGMIGGLWGSDRSERRRTAALESAAMVCSDDLTPQEIIAVATVFEAYLKGD